MERLRYTDWEFLIDDLIDEKHARSFAFERELLLYQFQTWIYIPHSYPIGKQTKQIDVVTDA